MRLFGGEAGRRHAAATSTSCAESAASSSGRAALPPPLHPSRRCAVRCLSMAPPHPPHPPPPPMLRRAAAGGGRAPPSRALPPAAAAADAEPNRIVEYLEGRTLLVTGATGFLAKARACDLGGGRRRHAFTHTPPSSSSPLTITPETPIIRTQAIVEKVLRAAPGVRRVYLLIQPRGGQSPAQRLTALLAAPAFDALRAALGPAAFDALAAARLAAVGGDMSAPGLGLSPADAAALRAEVQVVINSAASTAFDERYDAAVALNTLGPAELAAFAAGCPRLEALLQVSTAFVNGSRAGVVAEAPFALGTSIAAERAAAAGAPPPPPLDVAAEVALAAGAEAAARAEMAAERAARGGGPPGGGGAAEEEAEAERRVRALGTARARLHGWQDTYVFTKAMGEMLLAEGVRAAGLPAAVLRPSIVEGAAAEPAPGWMEGIRMMDPLVLAYGRGRMPGFPMDGRARRRPPPLRQALPAAARPPALALPAHRRGSADTPPSLS